MTAPLSPGEGLIGGFLRETERQEERRSRTERLRIMRKEQEERAALARRQAASEEAAEVRRLGEAGFEVMPFAETIQQRPTGAPEVPFLPIPVPEFETEGGVPTRGTFVPGFLGQEGAFVAKTRPSPEEQRMRLQRREGEFIGALMGPETISEGQIRELVSGADPEVLGQTGVAGAISSRLREARIAKAQEETGEDRRLIEQAYDDAQRRWQAEANDFVREQRLQGVERGDEGFIDPDEAIPFEDFLQREIERRKRAFR